MQTNPEISTDEFYRIKRLPPYVFAEVNKLKAQLRADGQDIIDFGFGNPDLPTPQHVIDKLIETVQKPRVTGYSASRGIKGLCLLYTSPSPRDQRGSRMPSSA